MFLSFTSLVVAMNMGLIYLDPTYIKTDNTTTNEVNMKTNDLNTYLANRAQKRTKGPIEIEVVPWRGYEQTLPPITNKRRRKGKNFINNRRVEW